MNGVLTVQLHSNDFLIGSQQLAPNLQSECNGARTHHELTTNASRTHLSIYSGKGGQLNRRPDKIPEGFLDSFVCQNKYTEFLLINKSLKEVFFQFVNTKLRGFAPNPTCFFVLIQKGSNELFEGNV